MRFTLRSYQKDASDAAVMAFRAKNKKNGLLILPTGCHAKGTKIIMADGKRKPVEDIVVGDMLLGTDGYRKVLSLHRGEGELYKITPAKGEAFVVNGGHILHLYKTNEGKPNPSCRSRYDEISVNEYISKSSNYKHLHKLHRIEAVDFTVDSKLTVPPYLLGLLLGDGYIDTPGISITTMESEVVEYLTNFATENGYTIAKSEKANSRNKACSYRIKGNVIKRQGERYEKQLLRFQLEDLGLWGTHSGNKFIPQCYLSASCEQRRQLLAGLLDTDAYYDLEKNIYEYCSKSKKLCEDIVFLCRSLGLYAGVLQEKIVNDTVYYRFTITGDTSTFVSRRQGRARFQKKSHLVTGFSVEYVGKGEYYGFTLDGNHLYCDEQFFVHHNSGKSLVIADIASKLDGPLLVFQPSKEILEQNFAKLQSYGIFDCGVYSASVGFKDIRRITFATIGSVMNHMDDFAHFKNVLIDECHLVNSKAGQYKEFIEIENRQVVGLTATPYRLGKGFEGQSMLKFLTRTRPRIFSSVLYYCQISELLSKGYLAELQYFDLTCINIKNVQSNSTGADFDEDSLRQEYERSGFYDKLTTTTLRVLKPKSEVPRKGVLVFTRFIKEANELVHNLSYAEVKAKIVTGETPKRERESILADFKRGAVQVVANVGTLTTGFDYPELDTVILARPTKSLALYYQMVGRAIRPFEGKDAWVIDLGGSYRTFGKVSDLRISCPVNSERWVVTSNGRPLTNVSF